MSFSSARDCLFQAHIFKFSVCQTFQRAHARGLARGGGLASHPLCPGVELDQPPVRRGARVNPPGKSGGVRVIACPAGQGSSGESVPDGPARGATPTSRLRNDGGLASYASGMLSTLGLSEAQSPGFNPTVQLDKSGVPLFRSHFTPFVRRQGRRSPVRFQPGASDVFNDASTTSLGCGRTEVCPLSKTLQRK